MINLEALSVKDYLDIAARRKWLILTIIFSVLAMAFVLSILLPKSYRSNTLILVENSRIQESYVSPIMQGSVSDRLSMIQQQVLSRSVLGRVIEEFDLVADRDKGRNYDSTIEALKKNIKVETKGSGHVEAFIVSFSHSNPETARAVTQKLAMQFIESNLQAREDRVQGTTEFLENELKRAKESLDQEEGAIVQFKRQHMGELPSQTDANLQTLNRLQRDLQTVNDQLQNRADRRAGVLKMLNAYEELGLTYLENPQDPAKLAGSSPQGVVVRGSGRRGEATGADTLTARLRELERTLATLKTEYKDTYPDVMQVNLEIASIKAKQAEASSGGSKEGDKDFDVQPKDLLSHPTKAQTQKGASTVIDPYLYELRREREEIEIGMQTLTEQHRTLKSQIRLYEQRVEKAPEREQEMLVLQRDYENNKKNYQTLLEKQLSARISENLEKHQKGETFKILDPANLPNVPESPDQGQMMLVGLLLGCGMGYGTAFTLEILAGVIRRPEEAESLLGLPVLATIPSFSSIFKNNSAKQLTSSAMMRPSQEETGGASRQGSIGSETSSASKA